MPLFLILSACASQHHALHEQYNRDVAMFQQAYQRESTALRQRQAEDYEAAKRRVATYQGDRTQIIREIATALGKQHAAEAEQFNTKWRIYQAEMIAKYQEQPSPNRLLGLGMALSRAAAGAYQPLAPIPQGSVIIQPGQMPTYFYNYGTHGTLVQPGHMPTYIYPTP